MTDYTNLQKRCQRGEPRVADANGLLAECYGALGVLMAEVKKIDADRKACWAEFKVQGRQLDELKAENEALRKDAERIDWLDGRSRPVVEGQCLASPGGELTGYDWGVFGQCATVREAIDDAM